MINNEEEKIKKAVQSVDIRCKKRNNHFVFHRVTVLCISLFLWLAARVQHCMRACVRARMDWCVS